MVLSLGDAPHLAHIRQRVGDAVGRLAACCGFGGAAGGAGASQGLLAGGALAGGGFGFLLSLLRVGAGAD
jgi:hypothetical protein